MDLNRLETQARVATPGPWASGLAVDPQDVLQLIARVRAAEALLEEVPEALKSAGADLTAEEFWAEKVAAYRSAYPPGDDSP